VTLQEWFAARWPPEWSECAPEIGGDSDEILVVVRLRSAGANEAPLATIRRFREETREQRMAVARAAEEAFGRRVAWGAACGDTTVVFTTISVPVMTRLRLPERQVLDTLIDAGIARSRSEALAWCVRLVGDNEAEWIGELRAAFAAVEGVRAAGPRSRRK
jgi:hypothetical protein